MSGSVTLDKSKDRTVVPAGPGGWLSRHRLLAIIVAAVALVGAGVTTIVATRGSGGKVPSHTPNLGLQVWQVQHADKISTAGGHSTAKLTGGPFSLRFPTVPIDNGPRICAWTDASIFEFHAGTPMGQVPCLKPGTVLPTPGVGASDLLLATDGHNNLVGDRLIAVDGGYDEVNFTALSRATEDAPLGWGTDVYLAVFIDRNANGVLDAGEFDFLVLDF